MESLGQLGLSNRVERRTFLFHVLINTRVVEAKGAGYVLEKILKMSWENKIEVVWLIGDLVQRSDALEIAFFHALGFNFFRLGF